MKLLTAAAQAYALAKDVQPERYRITCAPARRFSQALNQLARALADEAENPLWEVVLSSARAGRWRSGAEAIPYDAPSSGAREPLQLLQVRASALDGLVEGAQQRALSKLAQAATDLLHENNSTLAAAVVSCLSDGDPTDTCVVASNARTAQAISSWLPSQGMKLPVLKPREFMLGRHWNFAVIIGAGDWFPSQMFTCPRAEALTLVHHAHLRDSVRIQGIFGRFATVPFAVEVREPIPNDVKHKLDEDAQEDAEGDSAAEQSPQPQWATLLQHAPLAATDEEQVSARLVLLAGGFGLWLPADAVTIRGLDLTAAPGERVVPLKITTVTSDSVLVVRETGSVSGILAAMADSALGTRAAAIRQRQQQWKGLLRREIARVGVINLERTLRRLGSATANLRFWAGDENIRPQSDHDFAILLKHLGVEDPGPYILDGRELWKAHHRAGVQLAAGLEQALEAADLTELESSGRQQLHVTGQALTATLTAFRVIAVQEEAHTVAASTTRRTFKLKGAQWLE